MAAVLEPKDPAESRLVDGGVDVAQGIQDTLDAAAPCRLFRLLFAHAVDLAATVGRLPNSVRRSREVRRGAGCR